MKERCNLSVSTFGTLWSFWPPFFGARSKRLAKDLEVYRRRGRVWSLQKPSHSAVFFGFIFVELLVFNEKRLGNQPVPRKFILSYATSFLYSALTNVGKFIQKKVSWLVHLRDNSSLAAFCLHAHNTVLILFTHIGLWCLAVKQPQLYPHKKSFGSAGIKKIRVWLSWCDHLLLDLSTKWPTQTKASWQRLELMKIWLSEGKAMPFYSQVCEESEQAIVLTPACFVCYHLDHIFVLYPVFLKSKLIAVSLLLCPKEKLFYVVCFI